MSHLRRRISGTFAVRVVVVSLGGGLLLASCSDGDDPAGSAQPQETASEETSPTESEPTDAPRSSRPPGRS